MAATANRDALHGDGQYYSYGVASGVQVYADTLGELRGGNYVGPAQSGATNLVGVIVDPANNTSSNSNITVAQGALSVRVSRRGIYRFKSAGTPTQSHINQYAIPTADDTVGITNSLGVSGVGVGLGAPTAVGRVVGYGTSPYNYYDIDLDVK